MITKAGLAAAPGTTVNVRQCRTDLPLQPPRSTIEHMFDMVSYRIEGDGPVTAVLTYQNREYRHTSRTMWLGHEDGMPQGSIQLDEHVWARLQRINGTIEATITDSETGESYTLTPE